MNKHLRFLFDSLEDEAKLTHLILNSVVAPSTEESINRMLESNKLSADESRLLQYFFKTQSACTKLLEAAGKGLEFEAARLVKSLRATTWKKKQLNILSLRLRIILRNVFRYGKMYPGCDERFEQIVSKMGLAEINKLSKQLNAVKDAREVLTAKVDSKEILTEQDLVQELSPILQSTFLTPEALSNRFTLDIDEILFFHLYGLFADLHALCDLFTNEFRKDFHFSIKNIIEGVPIEIVPERVELKNEKVNLELFEILKNRVSAKSVKPLHDFFEGRDIEQPIEFLRSKQELMSVFLLLYRNNDLITSKPKLISLLVSKSFVFPNSRTKRPEIKPARVREFIIRTKASDSFAVLPEILEFAKNRGFSWDFPE